MQNVSNNLVDHYNRFGKLLWKEKVTKLIEYLQFCQGLVVHFERRLPDLFHPRNGSYVLEYWHFMFDSVIESDRYLRFCVGLKLTKFDEQYYSEKDQTSLEYLCIHMKKKYS